MHGMKQTVRIALCAAIATLAAGCSSPNADLIKLAGCNGPSCRLAFHAMIISADGGEVTVPFDCRSPRWSPDAPKGKYEKTMAIAYSTGNQIWRVVPFTAEEALANDNSKDFMPTVPGDYESAHACAADCGKFVYLACVDPKNPIFHYEVFYSENGRVRQLTHFNVNGAPLANSRLSADGRTAIVRFGMDVALIDVASGDVTRVPFGERAWQACTAS